MNFNFFFIIIFFLSGCGVKARPLTPHETAIQSYIESYTESEKPKK